MCDIQNSRTQCGRKILQYFFRLEDMATCLQSLHPIANIEPILPAGASIEPKLKDFSVRSPRRKAAVQSLHWLSLGVARR